MHCSFTAKFYISLSQDQPDTHTDAHTLTNPPTPTQTWYLVAASCVEYCNSRVLGFLLNQQQVGSLIKVVMSRQITLSLETKTMSTTKSS